MLLEYESERLKGVVHGAIAALTAVCAVYNVWACIARPRRVKGCRRRHLAINGLVYTTATLWEFEHLRHHWHSACHPRN
jgi:hypothetical protein